MKIKKAALVAMSDTPGIKRAEMLRSFLESRGMDISFGNSLKSDVNRNPRLKAKDLNRFLGDESIDAVFDISGGDSAHHVLEFIDFASFEKPFFGYSDLTVILNAAVSRNSGGQCCLFQPSHVLANAKTEERFFSWINGGRELEEIDTEFLRGDLMEGQILGGNIRCFSKLIGTSFIPDLNGAVFFMEARSGNAERINEMTDRLKNEGLFEGLSGIMIGQLTEADRLGERKEVLSHVLDSLSCPVCQTQDVGHSRDSKLLQIGMRYEINESGAFMKK